MQSLTLNTAAKINLSLDVVGKRADGYHLLSTVMQSVSLADQVYLELDKQGSGLILLCDTPGIPLDEQNTACRAARLFLDATGIDAGVRIYIEKKIPAAAGLAGGSSDAAAVLFGLSELCDHPLDAPVLFGLAERIGADVPFCLLGGTALCEGIGEILTPLPAFDGLSVLLVKPDFGLSTPWVFSQLDLARLGSRPDQPALIDAMRQRDLEAMRQATANVLESVSIKAHPVLNEIRGRLTQLGAGLAMMSGSGPTVFGLFADSETCDQAMAILRAEWPDSLSLYRTVTQASGLTVR